jgi:DNA-binding transcriptional regulator YhcF (GntR family)
MSTLAASPSSRPIALTPLVEAIPAELQARPQWVVWRYEQRNGRWSKVPYTPGTTQRAASNRPGSWRSFSAAVACYHERPDYFDGVGYVFSAEDPYVGGDFDHCLDAQGVLNDFARSFLPTTYAEVSPSGQGVKFIARASLAAGRKTSRAELYGQGRFFTFTGHVLDAQHTTITEQQAAIDSLLAVLSKDTLRHSGEGRAGGGNRAGRAAQVPESAWEAGRQLLRMEIERLLIRVRKAAGEETQLAVLLRREYAAFHERWPHVGLYRADGTLDASQVRAVAACGIKGRGFSFPEYLALMSHLYAAEALGKWGTKQLWREELVALWERASAPVHPFRPRRAASTRAARGRASDHATLVERVYKLLEEHRAGAEALVRTEELASAAGVHRRTIAAILDELRQDGRITTRRAGRYAGLVVSFAAPAQVLPTQPTEQPISDVIYSARPDGQPSEQPIPDVIYSAASADRTTEEHPAQPISDVINSAAPVMQPCEKLISDVIYSVTPANRPLDQPISLHNAAAPPAVRPATQLTEQLIPDMIACATPTGQLAGQLIPDVINSDARAPVSPLPARQIDALGPAAEETNQQTCVSSERGCDHICATLPTPRLADAITELLDSLPRQRLDTRTGQLKRWPITLPRVLTALKERYPAQWPTWQRAAPGVYRRVRAEREAEQFAAVRQLSAEALDKELTNLSRTISLFEQRAAQEGQATLRAHWTHEANRRRGRLALLIGERQRRDEREERRIEREGYPLAEQAEMLELVEATRPSHRPSRRVRVSQASASTNASTEAQSLIARLRDRKGAGVCSEEV